MSHPLVDRSDNPAKGGRFVMDLSEGETVLMKHKETGEVSYFVVAKLKKRQTVFLVPHWDARCAGERKNAEGKKIEDSKRDQFRATPSDFLELAPPGEPHAIKVHVSPMGRITKVQYHQTHRRNLVRAHASGGAAGSAAASEV